MLFRDWLAGFLQSLNSSPTSRRKSTRAPHRTSLARYAERYEDRTLLTLLSGLTLPSTVGEGDVFSVSATNSSSESIRVWVESQPTDVTTYSASITTTDSQSYTQSVAPSSSFSFNLRASDDDRFTLTLRAELASDPAVTSASSGTLSVTNQTPSFGTRNWSHAPVAPSMLPTFRLGDDSGLTVSVPLIDPGDNDRLKLTVDWGNGVSDTCTSGSSSTFGCFPYMAGDTASLFNYDGYSAPGTYTVTLTLEDDDGATVTTQDQINVIPSPPTVTLADQNDADGDGNLTEERFRLHSDAPEGRPDPSTTSSSSTLSMFGEAVSFAVIVDDAEYDLARLTVQWGDGDSDVEQSITTSGNVSTILNGEYYYSHSYGDDGPYTITITAEDLYGAVSTPIVKNITLNNVEPKVCIGTSSACNSTGTTGTSSTSSSSGWTVAVGDVVPLNYWVQERAWDDTLTITADWGGAGAPPPGSPATVTASSTSNSGTFTVSGGSDTISNDPLEWIYTQAGNFTITLKAQDDDMAPTDWSTDQLAILVKPTVSIEATDDKASEIGDLPGEFTISRLGTTNGDVTIPLTITGSADLGDDYVLVSPNYDANAKTITIPNGDTSVTLKVDPKPNAPNNEPDETIEITLGEPVGYLVKTATDDVTLREGPKLVGIDALTGVAEIEDGPNLPNADTTTVFAGPVQADPTALTWVELIPEFDDPGINVNSPPAGMTVTWTTGQLAGTLKTQIPHHIEGKWTPQVSYGGDQQAAVVYVVRADVTGFMGTGAATNNGFPDNPRSAGKTGMDPVNPATGAFTTFVEVQYTVKPSSLIADGNAGHFRKNDLRFSFHRQRRIIRADANAAGTFTTRGISNPNSWIDDGYTPGTADADEWVKPWATNGHIYDGDKPGIQSPNGTDTAHIFADNFREWAELSVTAVAGSNITATRASLDIYKWHAFRNVTRVAGVFTQTGVNDTGPGNQFWPAFPAPINASFVTITNVTDGQTKTGNDLLFDFTIQATPPAGAVVQYSLIEGQLPPGVTLNSSSGRIMGNPAVESGTFEVTIQALGVSSSDSTVVIGFADLVTFTIEIVQV